MNIASMFLRILAILGAIAAGVMFWIIGDTKEKLEADLQSTESQLTSTKGDLSNLQSEHETLQEEAGNLRTSLDDAQARATNLQNQLTQVRQELAEANKTLNTRQEEAESLKAEAARIRRELLDERKRVTNLEETLESEDAAALRASIRQLEQQLLQTERQIQTVEPSQNGEEQGRVVLRGQVTEVGDQSAYIVIDLGATDGARENATVMIRRGPRYVGRAQIRDVKEDASVAEVMPGASSVETGDQAITLN